jgi:hypothetical protein
MMPEKHFNQRLNKDKPWIEGAIYILNWIESSFKILRPMKHLNSEWRSIAQSRLLRRTNPLILFIHTTEEVLSHHRLNRLSPLRSINSARYSFHESSKVTPCPFCIVHIHLVDCINRFDCLISILLLRFITATSKRTLLDPPDLSRPDLIHGKIRSHSSA